MQNFRMIPAVAIMVLAFVQVTCGNTLVQDDFDDNVLDSDIWTAVHDRPGPEHRYPEESNGRLEIHMDGTVNDSAGVITNRLLDVTRPFRAQVDFNAEDCSSNAALWLSVNNVTTDAPTNEEPRPLDEFVGMAIEGNDSSDADPMRWGASKFIDDKSVATKTEEASGVTGTLYIENTGDGTLHLSHEGFGAENALATYDISDWTNCDQVFVGLYCWSDEVAMDGSGSYFDNFRLELEPQADVWYAAGTDLGNDWYWLGWFGSFSAKFDPWIFHNTHGFLYCVEASNGNGLYFYDMDLGWLFTSENMYPSMYSFTEDTWLWYERESKDPRRFVDLATGEWKEY